MSPNDIPLEEKTKINRPIDVINEVMKPQISKQTAQINGSNFFVIRNHLIQFLSRKAPPIV